MDAGGFETPVKWYAGRTTLSGRPALLAWDGQRVRLTEVAKETGEHLGVVFDHAPAEIRRARRRATVLVFDTPSGKVKVEFGYAAGLLMGTGPAGRRAGAAKLEEAGQGRWLELLGDLGVATR